VGDTFLNAAELRAALDQLTDPIFIKDRAHRWVGCNEAFARLLGHPREALLGKDDMAFFPEEIVRVFWENDDLVFSSKQPRDNEEKIISAEGERTIWTRKYPTFDEAGEVQGLIGIITDVTDLRQRLTHAVDVEQENARIAARIEAQQAMLNQLAAPAIVIWDGILLMPIVGDLTAERTENILQTLLDAISRHRARIVVIDVTGLNMLETSLASQLFRAVQAARLLGARCIVVGMSPALAQTLVSTGIEFHTTTTLAVLQDGLRLAFRELGYRIERTSDRR
jgi:rsbT co-antagonist protein RsbR